MTAGPICPVCGHVAVASSERTVPVRNPENARELGWSRVVRTYVHVDLSECELPMAPVFER